MNVPLFEKIGPMAHYYGDTVRKFFLAAGIILLVAIRATRNFCRSTFLSEYSACFFSPFLPDSRIRARKG
ncbi:MAG: hypothetical protein A3D65_04320 [Candidatus Lloydbacteria bacterium RIFCSPHIGHO2_02_FULL_50_13]|uniref:Uncharacterized protein n=1 Tax=Candidatus Lloydbacteria bacterium RIFCSPHIGHO2_02_FULL_50_13 TaxID=1798661 RepID=A0A1G2D2M2_9BACT|nr:MAG: hypothetical protein A3D65_04320 [Candidatus Lloydbacteria bacterium RIFCSPHIGHO2_02_FULL_50_13]